MSDAYRNLSPHQFAPTEPVYHGSGFGFAPGDVIHPTPDYTHMGGESAAFGVTNTSTAGYFGIERTSEPRQGQGRLFASVYEVEPMSHFEHHPADQKAYNQSEKYRKEYQAPTELPENRMPIDRKGFRVKRHAAFAFPDQEGLKKGHLYEKLQET